MGIPKPKRLVTEVSEWWRYLGSKQLMGYVSALAGIILTIFTAAVTGPNQVLLAVIAVFAQAIAAFFFSSQGKVHPTHAKRAFGRLIALAEKVSETEKAAQQNFEAKGISTAERQTQMGILSTQLSWIGDGIYSAAADWVAFNEPLNEMINTEQRSALLIAAQEAKDAAEIEEVAASQASDDATQYSREAGDKTDD